jgi:signal transduction histidine kinase
MSSSASSACPAPAGPGSGLGLAIVREIARGADGDVDILTPATGRGSLLRVRLPAIQPAADGEGVKKS